MSKEELKKLLTEMFKDGTIKLEVHSCYWDGATESVIRVYIDDQQVYFHKA